MSREELEAALAGLIHENNELRAIVRSIREYAQCVRQLADEYTRAYQRQHDSGSSYMAHLYNEVASAVERRIGDRP